MDHTIIYYRPDRSSELFTFKAVPYQALGSPRITTLNSFVRGISRRPGGGESVSVHVDDITIIVTKLECLRNIDKVITVYEIVAGAENTREKINQLAFRHLKGQVDEFSRRY